MKLILFEHRFGKVVLVYEFPSEVLYFLMIQSVSRLIYSNEEEETHRGV